MGGGTFAGEFRAVTPPPGLTAADVAARLRDARILVRHFSLPGREGTLRITVGDGPATDRLLEAMSSLGGAIATGT